MCLMHISQQTNVNKLRDNVDIGIIEKSFFYLRQIEARSHNAMIELSNKQKKNPFWIKFVIQLNLD